jgi:hypothetical protein
MRKNPAYELELSTQTPQDGNLSGLKGEGHFVQPLGDGLPTNLIPKV